MSALLPVHDADVDSDTEQSPDDPWDCVLHDDPVNLMGFVRLVICEVFGYPPERASQIMLEAHTRGRAVAASGDRDRMTGYATRLHAHKLWATVERAS